MKILSSALAVTTVIALCVYFPFAFAHEQQGEILTSSDTSAETLTALPSPQVPLPTVVSRLQKGCPENVVTAVSSTSIAAALAQSSYFDPFATEYTALSTEEKFELLRVWFPAGKYWNCADSQVDLRQLSQAEACSLVSDTPCIHSDSSYDYCHQYDGEMLYGYEENIQCLAFASLISDFLFGQEAPFYTFYDANNLHVGDHIRYDDLEHSMIVTEVLPDSVKVVECNRDYENCQIEWDRTITFEELGEYDTTFYTRNIPATANSADYTAIAP